MGAPSGCEYNATAAAWSSRQRSPPSRDGERYRSPSVRTLSSARPARALPAPQIEEFEAEAEAAATAKKGKKPAPRVVHMEESIARHRQHIMRLEQLLRLLDNDAVQGRWEPAWPCAVCQPTWRQAARVLGPRLLLPRIVCMRRDGDGRTCS